MEVKKKYKQTELGFIPEDWQVQELRHITSLITNGFVGTVKSQYTESDDGVLYIQGYNVEENSFNFNGIKRVTQEFHKQHLKSCLRKDDLLTIQTGDVGLTTIVPKELEGSNCHALIISRINKGGCNPKFYSFYFNSMNGRQRLKGIETGTTMKHINVGDMIHFLVPVPLANEQTSIATALSNADALISSLEKLIAKKRKIKQGAMQQLLQPKEDWEMKKLGEVVIVNMGQSPDSKNYNSKGEGIPLIQGNADIDNRKQIVRFWTSQITKTCALGDVIMTVRAPVGTIGIATEKSCIGRGVCAFKPISIERNFLFHLMIFKEGSWKILEQGSTFTAANSHQIVQFEIAIPKSSNEQLKIASKLSDMDFELASLEAKLEKYKQIKRGMIQQLLTGKIRLV